MSDANDGPSVSRRSVLRASAGTVSLLGVGSARADEGKSHAGDCPEGTIRPSMVHYAEGAAAACPDDHPATQALHEEVAASLSTNFPTVGSLIERDFVPYADFFTAEGDSAWSHWLSPAFLDDDSVLDPERPESILVDHRYWRPIGVMFVATGEGDRVDPPPAVFEPDDGPACRPWHAHTGLPGRKAWWKFRVAYAGDHGAVLDGLPCRTPWMMHMWATSHPRSLYAHAAPPRGHRGGPPAEDPGFETDAVPGEDPLGPSVLPDAYRQRSRQIIERLW